MKLKLPRGVVVASIILLVFFWDLFGRGGDLPAGVAFHLTTLRLIGEGRLPYADFFDWSSPVLYLIWSLPYLIQQGLLAIGAPFTLESVAKLFVFLLVAGSFVFSYSIFYFARKLNIETRVAEVAQIESLATPLFFAFALSLFYFRLELGENQFLLLLALFPWLLVRLCQYQSLRLPTHIAVLAGILFGTTILLDLPYCLCALVVEILLSVSAGRMRPKLFINASMLSMYLVSAVFCLYLVFMPSEMAASFFGSILPLKWLNYQVFHDLHGYSSCADLRAYLYLAFVALLFGFYFGKQKMVLVGSGLSICGLLFFVLERQSYSHDLIVASGSAVMVLALCVSTIYQKVKARASSASVRWETLSFYIVSLSFVLLAHYSVSLARERVAALPFAIKKNGLDDLSIVVANNSSWHDPVILLSDNLSYGYPMLTNLDRRPCNYLIWARPLRLFHWLDERRLLNDQYALFARRIYDDLRVEFDNKEAELVIVDSFGPLQALEKEGLLASLETNYSKVADCYYYSENKAPREYMGIAWPVNVYKRKANAK